MSLLAEILDELKPQILAKAKADITRMVVAELAEQTFESNKETVLNLLGERVELLVAEKAEERIENELERIDIEDKVSDAIDRSAITDAVEEYITGYVNNEVCYEDEVSNAIDDEELRDALKGKVRSIVSEELGL